ncbi:hypothetical protein GIB67_000869 [Kingdonia uniflora]|uniref:DUF7648 domain-containing protein n=1 Tax=Kingdonia uniflora TaxID=39325 RepID=A0A7J7LG00_9MAGN|nr:hypothetical protein GIB67_000869 [Kingdonia uniflora]
MSSENLSVHDSSICSSPSIDYKAHGIYRDSEAAFSFDRKNNPEERISASGESLKHKLELKETYSGPKHSLKHVEELSQIGVEKSPCTEVTNKSSSLRRKAPKEPVSPSKQRSFNQLGPTRSGSPGVDCNLEPRFQALEPCSIKKDRKEIGTLRDTTRHGQLRKISKEHSRVFASSVAKTSYTRRTSHASTSMGTLSELKEHVLCSSLKASVVEHLVSTLPLHYCCIKNLTVLLEFLGCHVRQAANMPQLSSPTAIHTKRAFSSRGKDQISVSRRKNKEDLPKDTFRNSRELNDESKQIGRFPSSPDGRRQPPLFASGSSTKKESRSGSHSRRSSRGTSDDDDSGPRPRTLAGLLNEIMSKGERMTYEELCNVVLSHWQELRKHNGERYAYSSHSQAVIDCLRNRNEWAQLVDRGPKVNKNIHESVMSKFKNLNSTLDCVSANTGRKRRKLDPEPPMVESEENEHENGRSSKELDCNGVECLHREEYPKGKRKARKRRRLALQGRGVKEVTKRGKGDTITDDENEPFSPSSEGTENNSSEDESQEANKTSPLVSEASTSSEETAEILHKVLKKGLKAPRRNQANSLSRRLERESLEGVKCLVNEALLRGGVPSSASYSAMVNDLYSEGKIDYGNRVFDEIRERGFIPPVSTYEAKITALCRQGRADFAEDVVEKEMVKWNFVPRVRTYNILIKGLCMEGKSMRAVHYLSKMVEQVGCIVNEESYGILVDGLCSEGHFVEASKAFDKMLDNKYRPNNAAYNKVIGGLCIVDRRYEAVLWLEEMVSHGRTPEVPWSGVTANHSTSPFADDIYEKIKDFLIEDEVVINRWPQYSLILENAVTIVEQAVIKALEKQYSDILTPLKDNIPKKLGFHVQKLTRRQSTTLYFVPNQTQGNRSTWLKRILEDLKEADGEAEVCEKMQILYSQLMNSISNLHEVFMSQIFVTCRGFWDGMGQEITSTCRDNFWNSSYAGY